MTYIEAIFFLAELAAPSPCESWAWWYDVTPGTLDVALVCIGV